MQAVFYSPELPELLGHWVLGPSYAGIKRPELEAERPMPRLRLSAAI